MHGAQSRHRILLEPVSEEVAVLLESESNELAKFKGQRVHLIVVLVERVVYTKSTVCIRGTVAISFATGTCFYSINGVPIFTTIMTLNTKVWN